MAKGDFNNDGREDLLTQQYFTSNGKVAYQIYLSNGDGTYDAPKTLPTSVAAIGDFNHDGRLDFASYQTGTLFVYLGNGDGTFQSARTVTTASPSAVVAADVNHDGKTDLVSMNNGNIQVWISKGDGTFTQGETISTSQIFSLGTDTFVTGDFDGDSKPDIAAIYSGDHPTIVEVWYGDGAGHFGSPYTIRDPNNYLDQFDVIADVNNDGRSDLVAAANTASQGNGPIPVPFLTLFTGNANRTLSYSTLATSECNGGAAIADLNGDGISDLAYAQNPCSGSSATNSSMVVRLGKSSGGFASEQIVYQMVGILHGPFALRGSTGTKPDLIFSQDTRPSGGPDVYANYLLSNTSTGSFPGCGLSGIAEGVQICSPGASATSPVKFSVAAAGPTPMRTAAVWVDGKKVGEQLTHAFSNYSFLDASVALAAGSHAITVYGTGWDNTLQSKSFTLTVGSGGSCPFVGNGVNLCSPASGATVSSPVTVLASSNIPGTLARMEVWIDGVKKYTETTSATLSYTISLAAGSHRFAVFAVNTAGGKTETFDYATVK
jgi:hypothetical protein